MFVLAGSNSYAGHIKLKMCVEYKMKMSQQPIRMLYGSHQKMISAS